MARAYNFSPGPAALPEAVLRQAQAEMLEFGDAGASIVELSHRGPEFLEVARQTEADLPVTCQESAEQELRALLIHSNTCKTLYLTNLESGDVVGDKVEILAEYCSSGKSKRTVLEGIVGQALKLPEVVSAGWEVL